MGKHHYYYGWGDYGGWGYGWGRGGYGGWGGWGGWGYGGPIVRVHSPKGFYGPGVFF